MGFLYLLNRFSKKFQFSVADVNAVFGICVVAISISLSSYLFATKDVVSRAPNSVEVEPHRRDLVEWMRANIKQDDRYVEGPNFRWLIKEGKHIYPPYDSRIDSAQFIEFICDQ